MNPRGWLAMPGLAQPYSTGVCVVAAVSQGRIRRMDEYLDSSVIEWGRVNALPG